MVEAPVLSLCSRWWNSLRKAKQYIQSHKASTGAGPEFFAQISIVLSQSF